MNLNEIKQYLPHREPFLFLDEVTRITDDEVEGYRDIREDEFYFKGHFPGLPVFPGVLMIEALAQIGILVALKKLGGRGGKNTLFASIERARFKRLVQPGERILLKARLLGFKAGIAKIKGEVRVGDELACVATVIGALRD